MKTFTKFLTMLAVAALFATGCVNEEPPYKEDPNPEPTRQAEISYAVFCLKKKNITSHKRSIEIIAQCDTHTPFRATMTALEHIFRLFRVSNSA